MAITGSENILVGYAYPVEYQSPVFTNETLAKFKRHKHIGLSFDNATERFTADDLAVEQAPSELLNQLKYRTDCNICLVMGNGQTGEFLESIYDKEFTEEGESRTTFREALQAVGIDYQIIVFSTDRTYWCLASYQFDAKLIGRRFYSGA